MTADIDNFIDGFPHPTIIPIIGPPTYASLAELHVQLNANAASIFSNLGNGQLGLLALTVKPAVYTTLSATPFVVPANPGPQPVIAANATQYQIAQATSEHKEELRIWKEYQAADKALKQQLLAAINELYYKTLCNRITG